MSLKIRSFIGVWKDVLTLVSVIIGLGVFLVSSSRSSGRQEQSLCDIKTTQADQTKSFNDFKVDQTAINIANSVALIKINANADKTAEVLHAFSIDHAKLMKMHNLYPAGSWNEVFPEETKSVVKTKPIEEKVHITTDEMQPFPR